MERLSPTAGAPEPKIDRPRLQLAAALAAGWRDEQLRHHAGRFRETRELADAFLTAFGRLRVFGSFAISITWSIKIEGQTTDFSDFNGQQRRFRAEAAAFKKALTELVANDLAVDWLSGELRPPEFAQADQQQVAFDPEQPFVPFCVVEKDGRRRATPEAAIVADEVVGRAIIRLIQGMDMYVITAAQFTEQRAALTAGNRLDGGRPREFDPYLERMEKQQITPREFATACVLGSFRDLSEDELARVMAERKDEIDAMHKRILDAQAYRRRRRIRKT